MDNIEITLKPFEASEASLDSIYGNESYDTPFVVRTKYGSFLTGELHWKQGHGNNYSFYVEGNESYPLSPKDITHIEVR